MKPTRPWFSMVLIILAAAIPAIFPLVSLDPHSTPLHHRSLAAIRGANFLYKQFGVATCDAMAVQALKQMFGQGVSASGCGVANIGFICGNCTVQANGNFGVNGMKLPNGGGQQPDAGPACGQLQGGTCVVTNPNGFPLNYACGGLQGLFGANGPVACSNLIVAGPQ